jgi:hypothetical protein
MREHQMQHLLREIEALGLGREKLEPAAVIADHAPVVIGGVDLQGIDDLHRLQGRRPLPIALDDHFLELRQLHPLTSRDLTRPL